MTSSKFSVSRASRATKSTLYSLSSPFKSSSNLSDVISSTPSTPPSHKRYSISTSSDHTKASSGQESAENSPPDPPKRRSTHESNQHQPLPPPRLPEQEQGQTQPSDRPNEEKSGLPGEASVLSDFHVGSRTGAEDVRRPRHVAQAAALSESDDEDRVIRLPASPTKTDEGFPFEQQTLKTTNGTPPAQTKPQAQPQQTQSSSASTEPQDKPVLRPTPRKSRTWAGRLSVFLPSLILPSTDHSPTSSSGVHRKPVPDVSPVDSAHSQHQNPGLRSSQTFDLGFTSSTSADLTLRHPSTIPHPTTAPPPLPSQHPHDAPTSASLPQSQSLPLREAPTSAVRAPSQNRLRKERRQSPPTLAPPLPPQEAPPLPPDAGQFPGKLQKDAPENRRRSNSVQQNRKSSFPMLGVQARATSPAPDSRGTSSSAQPPGTRIVSGQTSVNSQSPGREEKRGRLRRSWLPGGRSRSNSADLGTGQASQAWMLGDDTVGDYKTGFLLNGEKVPELWNESGAVYVYLFPPGAGIGPSFKVPIYAISSSQVFNDLIQSGMGPGGTRSRARSFSGRDSLTADDALSRRYSPPSPSADGEDGAGDLRLFLPGAAVPPDNAQMAAAGQPQPQRGDFDRLIAIRNLFAFLTGQPLVATKANPTTFTAFLQISNLLLEFGFTNLDGSSFGDAVDMSFSFFNSQLALSDVRHSREKTLEALILGERMRSMELYSEAFAHAVGKYTPILELKSPLFDQLSPQTRQKLERAHLDLVNRQHNINGRLEQFDFPSLFSGIANSTSIAEVKSVRFKQWRQSFNKMRTFVLAYYKSNFGNWPPKASSKKNPFSESGLNRLVLKALYSDMCALYDLLVDREDLTPRVIDGGPDDDSTSDNPVAAALRKVLTEFDASTPPVLPPIPFDIPQIPSMRAILETYDQKPAKEQARIDKRIKEHELILVLHKAYNYDTNTLQVPFLRAFKDFENHEARGKNAADLADQRIGYWLFLYVVIQSLPMLVIDAPGLQYTEGVEYFLCEPPMGNPPWLEDAQVRKMWYEVSGGAGYVELSADSVMFSVEAIYHRSHCWAAAKNWEGLEGPDVAAPTEPVMSPLAPPPMFMEHEGGPLGTPPAIESTPPPASPKYVGSRRTASPGRALASRNSAYRSSIAIGLEPVPMMEGLPGDRSSRIPSLANSSVVSLGQYPASSGGLPRNPSVTNLLGQQQQQQDSPIQSTMTFDDILGGSQPKTKKKKGKFF
ncbi:hypothetical protein BN1708_012596 [Verticillium longisporum]|uniref:DUF8004 domain-containing protein n=2 Tax=Verticillium longisporum TaxID=100787 RepID=A0A0G4LBB5_VERLO|nr:hypothetical protein BN1708_012596 [Verticillium longisporum]